MKLALSILALTLLVTAASAQTFSVFYTFNFTDGSAPNGGLILDSAGNFYGTTQFGGSSNRGIIFKLNPAGQETVLYTFTGSSDGGIPIGRLIRDGAGNLYGITSSGGDATCSCGTVFELTTTGTLQVLHAFLGGTDGSQNQGQAELGLVMIKGNLYGSASFGGVSGCDGSLGCGVLFKVTLAGVETVLYKFTGQADGAFPQDLISDEAGNIYGATGGSYMQGNGGTLFKLDTSGTLTTLYTFPEGAKGTSPRWRLIRTGKGVFYGVTQFGGNTTTCALGTSGCGVAFSVNAQGTERSLTHFWRAGGRWRRAFRRPLRCCRQRIRHNLLRRNRELNLHLWLRCRGSRNRQRQIFRDLQLYRRSRRIQSSRRLGQGQLGQHLRRHPQRRQQRKRRNLQDHSLIRLTTSARGQAFDSSSKPSASAIATASQTAVAVRDA